MNLNKNKVLFYFLGAMFAIALGAWLSTDESMVFFIKKLMLFKIPLVLVGLILMWFIQRDQDSKNEIHNLKIELNNANQQLDSETKALWKNYKDLSVYRVNQSIKECMRVIVDNFQEIDAIQLHSYSINQTLSNIVYKISFVFGYSIERIQLNSMFQNYYHIHKSIFKEYQTSKKRIAVGEYKYAMNFINSSIFKIQDSNEKTFSKKIEEFSILFSLVRDLINDLYNSNPNLQLYINSVLGYVSDSRVIRMTNHKKTGYLLSLINESWYIFSYEKDGQKNGRLYYTQTINIKGDNHLMTFIINPTIIDTDDINIYLKELEIKFFDMISKYVNAEYQY